MANWLALSERESLRFGLRVARHPIDQPHPGARAIIAEMKALGADIAVVRFIASDRAITAALGALGVRPVLADTLVYYGRLLDTTLWGPTSMAPKVRQAMPSDLEAVARIARLGFQGYRSHYDASACFPAEHVEAGYVEWALTHLQSGDPRNQTWVVEADGEPAGFATVRTDQEHSRAEILLNAVLPQHQGHGLYRALVTQALMWNRNAGIRHAVVSTQIWNIRVQRAWTALGFQLERAYNTYHLGKLTS